MPTMERAEIIDKSINGRGALIKVADMQQAIEVALPGRLQQRVEHDQFSESNNTMIGSQLFA